MLSKTFILTHTVKDNFTYPQVNQVLKIMLSHQ